MHRTHFQVQIGRIQSCFRNFAEERVELIWLRYKNIENDDFTEAVNDIIGNNNFTPTMKDFDNRLMSARAEMEAESFTQCTMCDSTGIVVRYVVQKCPMSGKPKPYSSAFRCNCENGNTRMAHYPTLRGHKTMSHDEYKKWVKLRAEHIANKRKSA